MRLLPRPPTSERPPRARSNTWLCRSGVPSNAEAARLYSEVLNRLRTFKVQVWRATEQLLVTLQARFPKFSVGHALGTNFIIGDELRLGFLDLHQLAELGGLHLLPFTNGLRVSFEHTEHLVGMMVVALQHPGARLLQHTP